jgi:DNA-binding HxlR family transcriptional regulator
MNIHHHQEIHDLFRSKWDPVILEVLVEQPHRFRELALKVHARFPGHIDDSTLNRALERLRRAGHIHASPVHDGQREIRSYHLTDTGATALGYYRVLITVYGLVKSND